ncbi:hypothetical protein DH2020_021261 [Rehmannia glutinosa]|uniref:Cupin type-1 domain-containing protein n=1 Tax=Rehmannia glutinosa TaxID=99300 RepID=A0ABR0W9W6_REHGL
MEKKRALLVLALVALVVAEFEDGRYIQNRGRLGFYLINTAEGQRLHVICSIDTSQSLGWNTFQSFFIAWNISGIGAFWIRSLDIVYSIQCFRSRFGEMLTRQQNGPIVYLSDTRSPSLWTKFLDMEHPQKLAHMRRIVRIREEDLKEEEPQPTWYFRKLLVSLFGKRDKRGDEKKGETGKGPDVYNIYDRKPDFRNDYGWSIALDESDYEPLKYDDFGVYLVNLTATLFDTPLQVICPQNLLYFLNVGSMMAPHINPRATEHGIVLSAPGTIQIVYPNGTLAMNAKVTEGDVSGYATSFCQIASRTAPVRVLRVYHLGPQQQASILGWSKLSAPNNERAPNSWLRSG